MEYFSRLGASLEDAWREVERDEERFPDVALQVLQERPPHQHFDREEFLDAVLDSRRQAACQLAPLGMFGQPGITVYFGDGFVIDIYYWLNSSAAIHNHPFCGLFTILEGYSLHARYRVQVLERIGSRALLIDAALDELKLLSMGDVEAFSAERRPLVHALIHVPVPSISMVVRTIRTHGYLRYLPPTVAIPMDAPQDPSARRIALLESLRLSDDPRYLERLVCELSAADFHTAVHILADGWAAWDANVRIDLLELLRARFGSAAEAVAPALEEAIRVAEASGIREQLRDPDLRLVAATLAYADDRKRVFAVLAERGDPTEMLVRFIQEAHPYSEFSPLVAHSLVNGEGREGALAHLVEAYGADAVRPHVGEVARFCDHSIYAPLAR